MSDRNPTSGAGDGYDDSDAGQLSFGNAFGHNSPPPAPNYHLRADGKACPRGHNGPFRNCRHDCAECRCTFARCWAVTRRAVLSALHGGAVAPEALRIIGVTAGEWRAFLAAGCARLGLRLADYGRTWGIYRRRQLRRFNLASDADFHAANQLGNLKVDHLHNAPHAANPAASTNGETPSLFPL